ncbi:MAG: RHS repeat-associated core domain-containing protein [Candidatus Nanoarchaeia archaeon]
MDSSGNCIERYQQGMMIDGIAGRQIGQSSLSDRYIKDHLGSVQRVIRENGVSENEYIYDSFGNIVYTSGTLSNQRLYTSRYYDSESGLYYYRARYYDSNTGRFISEDPIGFWGGANLYLYVENNPSNFTDPYGFQKKDCKEKPRDCRMEFFRCVGECLMGGPDLLSLIGPGGEAVGQYCTAQAWRHAARRNLSYPLKSSIVRRCLSIGNKAGPLFTLINILLCEGKCLMEEIKCINEQ